MTLLDYKKQSNLSFREIANKAGMGERTGAFHVCHKPERCTIDNVLRVAAIVSMPESEAKKEWEAAKIKQYQQKLKIKIK